MTATATEIRQQFVAIGNEYEAHASQFIYSEAADRAEIFNLTYAELLARLKAGELITGDCSSTWEATRKFAGCINLPPLGYTGSELESMPHIALADGLVGDGIVFGAYPGKHVVWLTEPHPTNPKVAIHWNPETDGHGEPGFTQVRLATIWGSVFAGLPITVLSLVPYLPQPPADPYHYTWFDYTQFAAFHGKTSEHETVINYDAHRKDIKKWRIELLEEEENLEWFVERLQGVIKKENDPKGLLYHRAWRLEQMKARAAGEQVVK